MARATTSPTDRAPATAAPSDVAWTPGLAQRVVQTFWATPRRLPRDAAYSSNGWLTGDAAPGTTVRVNLTGHPLAIEQLPVAGRSRYAALDLKLVDRPPTAAELELIAEAIALLDIGDGLAEAIRALVRVVHLLEPGGVGFDTSHSDPELPFTIFVSTPVGERHAPLRLAESILHEAMHLQLTLMEELSPLVHQTADTGYSPWQQRERPILGLIHGLFVFRVIDQWLDRLAEQRPADRTVLAYSRKRRSEIEVEVSLVSDLHLSPALTSTGAELVARLLEPVTPALPQADRSPSH